MTDKYVIYTDQLLTTPTTASKGWFANPTPEGIVYHEAGHIFNNLPYSKTGIGNNEDYVKKSY